jgi:hypothetical protein
VLELMQSSTAAEIGELLFIENSQQLPLQVLFLPSDFIFATVTRKFKGRVRGLFTRQERNTKTLSRLWMNKTTQLS